PTRPTLFPYTTLFRSELVREVKRLVDLTAHIDVERADRDELAQLADDAAVLADRLEPLPSLLEVGGMAAQQGPQGALLERSGIRSEEHTSELQSLAYL